MDREAELRQIAHETAEQMQSSVLGLEREVFDLETRLTQKKAERDAARLAYFALYALQHRGQESAGIAAADGGSIRSHKEMGLLGAIFDEEILSALSGHIAVGHTRYSTTGSSVVVNAQPLLERTDVGDFAFAHNGNLTNTDDLRETLSPTTVLQASSDSEVIAKLLVESKGSMVDRIRRDASAALSAVN